jgi:sec-independent protein translocase protein TatB
MLDIGWSELAIVGVIMLIVVGPKELPRVLRSAGQWAGKARKIAREFQNSLDDMVRESELDTVKKDIEKAASFDVKKDIENAIDPKGDVKRALETPAVDAGETPATNADEPGPSAAPSASPTPSAKVALEPKLPDATAPEPEVVATDSEEAAPAKSQASA